ncbi:hypothetical protein Fot_28717 [Forsythia ovata]|uniref:Uncharacterized protein n=1 Tax=Forsythia ovata TaxID=205694 RepID=A0ABD1TPT4_9LAMI
MEETGSLRTRRFVRQFATTASGGQVLPRPPSRRDQRPPLCLKGTTELQSAEAVLKAKSGDVLTVARGLSHPRPFGGNGDEKMKRANRRTNGKPRGMKAKIDGKPK